MKKRKLTQQDLDTNPILKEIGAKAGQTLEYSFVNSGKTNANEQSNEGDEGNQNPPTGGSQPPPGKERP